MLLHVVAHVTLGHRSSKSASAELTALERLVFDPGVAEEFWLRLRAAFPMALAACVLPSHVHLLLAEPSPAQKRAGFAARVPALHLLLGGLSSALGGPRSWAPVSCREVGASLEARLAAVSAIHYRPLRLGLVSDPLEWPWSTHRDLVGARLEPWLDFERLSSALGLDDDIARAQLRALVQPGSSPRKGTLRWAPSSAQRVDLAQIVRAADAACLYVPRVLRSAVLVHLAHAYGFRDVGLLAAYAGIARSSVERFLRSAPPPGLAHAELCALDPRLVVLPEASVLAAG